MRRFLRTRPVHLLMACGFAVLAHGAAEGKEFHWLGDVDGGNALNPTTGSSSRIPTRTPLPGAADQLVLRWGDRPSVPLEYGGTRRILRARVVQSRR